MGGPATGAPRLRVMPGQFRCALRPPLPDSPAPASRWFARNRRDGSRLLSSAVVIAGAGLVRFDHPVGRLVFVVAGSLSLFWWLQFRRLPH